MSLTRNQIKTAVSSLITDALNKQNTAKRVRDAYGVLVDNLLNAADDNLTPIPHNLTASNPPGPADDVNDFWVPFSHWIVSGVDTYICVSNAANNAIWVKVNNLELSDDPFYGIPISSNTATFNRSVGGNKGIIVLNQNVDTFNHTNTTETDSGYILLIQDSTGGRTFVQPDNVIGNWSISTDPNARTLIWWGNVQGTLTYMTLGQGGGATSLNQLNDVTIGMPENSNAPTLRVLADLNQDGIFGQVDYTPPSAASGEANTGNNAGFQGVGPYAGKIDEVLQFRNNRAGSNKVSIILDSINNLILYDIVPGNILTSQLNNDANFAPDQVAGGVPANPIPGVTGNELQTIAESLKALVDLRLQLSGGTLTGPLVLNADPVNAFDAVTKQYVDNLLAGLKWKSPNARVATTENITLSGTQTIDGIALSVGDRVVVKDQTTDSQNGLYVVDTGAWSRTSDADTAIELQGATISVGEGATNANALFHQTADNINLGTTAIGWIRIGDIGGGGATNLDYLPNPSQGTITSDTGTNAVIPAVNTTNAGLMTPTQNDKLSDIEPNAKDDQIDSEVPSAAIPGLSGADVRAKLISAKALIDALQLEVDSLDRAIVLQPGLWDASTGTFPAGAQLGFKYIVGIPGTIQNIDFAAGDTITAIVNNPSTTNYSLNWLRQSGTNTDNQTGAQVPMDAIPGLTGTDAQAIAESLKTYIDDKTSSPIVPNRFDFNYDPGILHFVNLALDARVTGTPVNCTYNLTNIVAGHKGFITFVNPQGIEVQFLRAGASTNVQVSKKSNNTTNTGTGSKTTFAYAFDGTELLIVQEDWP